MNVNCVILSQCNVTGITANILYKSAINADQQGRCHVTTANQPCKLSAFFMNVHLCAFEFIQLFADHGLTHAKTHHNTSASQESTSKCFHLQCYPIYKQEGLAVASIAQDDPSTLPGDDPFPRAH